MRSCLAVALLCVGACATAAKSGGQADASGKRDSNGGQVDSPNQVVDAPNTGPDSAMAITVTETSNTTVASAATIACYDTNTLSPTYGNTADNIWYRAFQLSDYSAISGGLHITGVTFGIEESSAAPQLTIKIGTYTGTLDGATINSAQVSSLAQTTSTPASVTNQTVMVPITADIPAGSKFVVTISAPDDTNNGYFFIGSTAGTETHKAYWSSAACGQSSPVQTMGTNHVIIDVVGTH